MRVGCFTVVLTLAGLFFLGAFVDEALFGNDSCDPDGGGAVVFFVLGVTALGAAMAMVTRSLARRPWAPWLAGFGTALLVSTMLYVASVWRWVGLCAN